MFSKSCLCLHLNRFNTSGDVNVLKRVQTYRFQICLSPSGDASLSLLKIHSIIMDSLVGDSRV